MTPTLLAHRLAYRYSTTTLFEQLEVSLEAGQVKVILGPSGSGKTTLLHLLAGLLPAQEGEVLWQGQSLAGLGQEALAQRRLGFLGLVFQHHHLLPELSALENVLLPGYLADRVDPGWARYLLERVGLGRQGHLRYLQLSGGERQRVALARALYLKPALLLCDEPTGSLDRPNAVQVMRLILELSRDLGTATLLATHDEALVAGLPEIRLGIPVQSDLGEGTTR